MNTMPTHGCSSHKNSAHSTDGVPDRKDRRAAARASEVEAGAYILHECCGHEKEANNGKHCLIRGFLRTHYEGLSMRFWAKGGWAM